MKNPKLEGTEIIDCIPQVGKCKNNCPECFFNNGRFFRDINEPLIPTWKEAEGKIVRVNTGHDSNLEKELVLNTTKYFEHKFYNTSIPNFGFPAPVVFTCNPHDKLIKCEDNLNNVMFVRVRTTSWDLNIPSEAIQYYLKERNIPVVITFMRFYNGDLIPNEYKKDYEWIKHIINEYYCIKPEIILKIMKQFEKTGVRYCGTPVTSNCKDCNNCELLYWKHIYRREV